MSLLFKLGLFLLFCWSVSSEEEEEELKCNLKFCGAELLNYEHFSITTLFRKMELAQFCIKNCTPPVVHEFFQSIVYGITKRIPGHCSGENCVDKNRFIALAKCVEHQSWPLLQCSKKLIDLAHIGLVKNPEESKKNKTCRIVTESVQCFEENLQKCGEAPFQLVKEILGDLIKIGINAYCHPSYSKEGFFMKKTTEPTLPSGQTHPPSTEEHTGATFKPPQYVKGYRPGAASALSPLSTLCLLTSVLVSVLFRIRH